MTVKELIEKLALMPQEAVVVIDMCSECRALDHDEPMHDRMIERNGTYMAYREKWWDKAKDGEPVLLDVCHFPGN